MPLVSTPAADASCVNDRRWLVASDVKRKWSVCRYAQAELRWGATTPRQGQINGSSTAGARLHAMKRAPMMPGIMARVISPAVLLLVVWAAVSPVEAAAAAASSSRCISPFPAFVTHRPPPASTTPTPRSWQRNSNNNGAANAKVGWQCQTKRQRGFGWFVSSLHQSTVAAAEPRSRNSTHEAGNEKLY